MSIAALCTHVQVLSTGIGGHILCEYEGDSVECTACHMFGPCGAAASDTLPGTHVCVACGACDKCCASGTACGTSAEPAASTLTTSGKVGGLVANKGASSPHFGYLQLLSLCMGIPFLHGFAAFPRPHHPAACSAWCVCVCSCLNFDCVLSGF